MATYRRARTFGYALTEYLNERKNAVHPDVELGRRIKRVITGIRPVRSLLDAVGPSLISATDLDDRMVGNQVRRLLVQDLNAIPPNQSCIAHELVVIRE